MRPIRLILHRHAQAHNLARVRQLAPSSRVMAILKANAYGHDLLASAKALADADAFGVLDLQDAIRLREADFDKPICLLEGLFPDDDPSVLVQYDLQPVIHSEWQLQQLAKRSADGRVEVCLKIDTGMSRLGFPADRAAAVYRRLETIPGIQVNMVMSHLANADDPDDARTIQQLEMFMDHLPTEGIDRSLANSAAVCAWPDTHLEWVRPGIMLYGSSPLKGHDANELGLRAAMTLQSEIIAIRELRRGDPVGYGGTWQAPEAMRIGIIACGYGDGYPRHAPSGTPVLIDGTSAPLVGRVSMDMIAVDLRGHDMAGAGSIAEMWGRGLPIDVVAGHAGTISYELMCGITARVPRVEG